MINTVSEADLRAWLIDRVATAVGLNQADVDPGRDLVEYAIDSSEAVELTMALEAWAGVELDLALLWEHHTIDAVAGAVARQVQAASASA